MTDLLKQILITQLEASLCMLNECIQKCPPGHWDSKIANYTFWQVAYHTLCYVDVYLCKSDDLWQPDIGPTGLHPLGRTELEAEYPSRRFDQAELHKYAAACHRKILDSVAAETAESLAGASGFPRHPFSRAELHIYNIRHIQHHTGQLSAFLRRVETPTGWVKTGWK